MDTTQLVQIVEDYYVLNKRDLPWRTPEKDGSYDAYKILVSELMLQQTQVSRVIPKYEQFLNTFPTVGALAQTELSEVLALWIGLGYNRRAKFLHQAARMVCKQFNNHIPSTQTELVSLPGIGPNTAGAILAYAYNQQVTFIETNIRTVFLHHCFSGQTNVHDSDILPLVEKALGNLGELSNREWYWALMDYGVYLKATEPNPSRRSKHHTKQSKFEGSRRQVRGAVLRQLANQNMTLTQLQDATADDHTQSLDSVLEDLQIEGLIHANDGLYVLGSDTII